MQAELLLDQRLSHSGHSGRQFMPSIRKRNAKWQAQVRLAGCPPLSKSFDEKRDARLWAAEQERNFRTQSKVEANGADFIVPVPVPVHGFRQVRDGDGPNEFHCPALIISVLEYRNCPSLRHTQ